MWFFLFPANMVAQSRLQQFDDRVLENLETTRTPSQTAVWRTVSDANLYVNVGIPATLLVTGLIKNDADMKQNALYMATNAISTELINLLIKKLVKRPRPFITNMRLTPVYKPGSYSFPSGHTSSAFSSGVTLARAYPHWYIIVPSLVWASAVGYSRMYLGVHYPSDVATGALLGTGTAFALGFMRR
ncbi:PAP2 family protein [Chitinophaga costaii]|nr:PAP2 family protein [Chitinophaga costaii]